jgi:hypothetical protein
MEETRRHCPINRNLGRRPIGRTDAIPVSTESALDISPVGKEKRPPRRGTAGIVRQSAFPESGGVPDNFGILRRDRFPTLVERVEDPNNLLNHIRIALDIGLGEMTIQKIVQRPEVGGDLSAVFHIQNGIEFQNDILGLPDIPTLGLKVIGLDIGDGLPEKLDRSIVEQNDQTAAILRCDRRVLIEVRYIHTVPPEPILLVEDPSSSGSEISMTRRE